MDSLTAQAQKGRTPATPPFTLYPFLVTFSTCIADTAHCTRCLAVSVDQP